MSRPSRNKSKKGAPSRPIVKVWVEGKTESQYLIHWGRKVRDRVTLVVSSKYGTPLTLVQQAAGDQRVDRKEAKRNTIPATTYWCVFDVDEHPNMPEAHDMARANGIEIIQSNPCLELWFYLHSLKSTREIDRKQAQKDAKEHRGIEHGRVTEAQLDQLTADFAVAEKHAIELDAWHESVDHKLGANPSSGMWRLVRHLSSF